MKYPIIVIGNVRYAPHALMEMQGDQVVSFKTLASMRRDEKEKPHVGHWLKKLMGFEGSVCRRQQCHANTSRFSLNK